MMLTMATQGVPLVKLVSALTTESMGSLQLLKAKVLSGAAAAPLRGTCPTANVGSDAF